MRKNENTSTLLEQEEIYLQILSVRITSSGAHKVIGKAALEGATKGVKTGAEEGSKQVIKKIADKATKSKPKSKSTKPAVKNKEIPPVEPTSTNIGSSSNNPGTIDANTRKLLDSLKTGRGIKLLT